VKHKCKIGSKELQKKSTMVEDAIEDLIALALEFKNGGAAAPPGGAAAPDPPDSESNSSAKACLIFILSLLSFSGPSPARQLPSYPFTQRIPIFCNCFYFSNFNFI
jgi:hypothetical protein